MWDAMHNLKKKHEDLSHSISNYKRVFDEDQVISNTNSNN